MGVPYANWEDLRPPRKLLGLFMPWVGCILVARVCLADPGGAAYLEQVKGAVEVTYKGTFRSPEVSGPAVPGKSVWVISPGMVGESGAIPSNAAKEAGAHAAYLSGGGSTIAALATTNEERIARLMQQAAVARGYSGRAMITEPTNQGATVLDA